jgi:hypothetical protein
MWLSPELHAWFQLRLNGEHLLCHYQFTMEHLMPSGCTSPSFVIPCFHYGHYGYAISMFFEDPAKRGRDISDWLENEQIYLGERSLEDLPVFLQSWLYFGFLAAVLDIDVALPLADFSRYGESERAV